MGIIIFLLTNWDSALLVIVVVMGFLIFYRRGEIAVIENLLFSLVVQAEKDFGSGTGELKKAAVITWVYERLPKIATFIITQKTIEQLLESALDYAKKKWTANPSLYEYVYGVFCGVISSKTDSSKK